jgi:transcriptional regulator with XRE-family HTH domain
MRMLAKRLKIARLASGFNDVESFAHALDMPATKYERFEEALEQPSLDDLRLISKITGKSLDFLISGMARAAALLCLLKSGAFYKSAAPGLQQMLQSGVPI